MQDAAQPGLPSSRTRGCGAHGGRRGRGGRRARRPLTATHGWDWHWRRLMHFATGSICRKAWQRGREGCLLQPQAAPEPSGRVQLALVDARQGLRTLRSPRGGPTGGAPAGRHCKGEGEEREGREGRVRQGGGFVAGRERNACGRIRAGLVGRRPRGQLGRSAATLCPGRACGLGCWAGERAGGSLGRACGQGPPREPSAAVHPGHDAQTQLRMAFRAPIQHPRGGGRTTEQARKGHDPAPSHPPHTAHGGPRRAHNWHS